MTLCKKLKHEKYEYKIMSVSLKWFGLIKMIKL